MYCNNCGEHVDEDSVFCQFCGSKITDDNSENQSNDSSKKKDVKSQPVKKSRADLLWEKFVEIYDAEGADKARFGIFSSPHVWELLERLSVNVFEGFIKDNKEELNKQPYKTIEALKNAYAWAVIGGYRLWLAEALLDNEKLNKFKPFSLDEFVEKWQKDDLGKVLKMLPEEMSIGITRYANFRFNTFIESAVEAKELSNDTVEKLKTSLLLQTLSGYRTGKIENTFRK